MRIATGVKYMYWQKISGHPALGLAYPMPLYSQPTVTLPLTPRKRNSITQEHGMGAGTNIGFHLGSMLSLHILLLIPMGWADGGLASAELLSALWCAPGRCMGSRPARGTLFSTSMLSVLAHKCLICVDWEVLLSPQASATSSPSSFYQSSASDTWCCTAANRGALWFTTCSCSFPKQLLSNTWVSKTVYIGGAPSKPFLVLEGKILNNFQSFTLSL